MARVILTGLCMAVLASCVSVKGADGEDGVAGKSAPTNTVDNASESPPIE